MAVLVTKTSDEFPWVDETVYDATVTAIKQAQGKDGPYLNWVFKLEEPTQDGSPLEVEISVIGSTSLKLSDKSKLGKWLTAAGISVDIGDTIDVEDVIGKEVQVNITIVEKNGSKKSYVKDVIARKKRAMKAAPAPAPAQAAAPAVKAAVKPQPKLEAPKVEQQPVEEVQEKEEGSADSSLFDWGEDDA